MWLNFRLASWVDSVTAALSTSSQAEYDDGELHTLPPNSVAGSPVTQSTFIDPGRDSTAEPDPNSNSIAYQQAQNKPVAVTVCGIAKAAL